MLVSQGLALRVLRIFFRQRPQGDLDLMLFPYLKEAAV